MSNASLISLHPEDLTMMVKGLDQVSGKIGEWGPESGGQGSVHSLDGSRGHGLQREITRPSF